MEIMEKLYTAWPGQPDEKDKNATRLLKKLRIALLFWLLSFIVTIIWFTNSPAF
jgi:hypothetical protein